MPEPGWWTVDPATGQTVRVLPAKAVEFARREASDSDAAVAVLREAAARARVIFRRTRPVFGRTAEEIEQARAELQDALKWMASGDLSAAPSTQGTDSTTADPQGEGS